MLGLVDYAVGNIYSICNAMDHLGLDYRLISEAEDLANVDRLLLPGVGAFDSAVKQLKSKRLWLPLKKVISQGMPTLGICLGMQLMCDSSEEGAEKGFEFIPANAKQFPRGRKLPVPHMGWNQINCDDSPLFNGVESGSFMYFVHSYYLPELPWTTAVCEYGLRFSAALQKDNLYGVQFHPEKSGVIGLKLLQNFGGLPC